MLNFCDFIQDYVFSTNHHLKQKRNRGYLTFSVKDRFFISLMNTKSGIFTRGFATRENTAFVVHDPCDLSARAVMHE